jgi:hypothetical protein
MSGDHTFIQLRHYAGPPSVLPGAAKVAQCDDEGNLLVAGTFSPGPPEPVAAPVTTVADFDTVAGNLIATACRCYQVRASNDQSVGMWLLLIDLATEPGDDDEAVWSMFVPAAGSTGDVFTSPIALVNGLSYSWSLRPKYVYLPPVFAGCSVSVATFIP